MKLRDFFYLNKSDRQVLLMLLSLAVVVLCAIYFLGEKQPETVGLAEQSTDSSVTSTESMNYSSKRTGTGKPSEEYTNNGRARSADTQYYQQPERVAERFPFDPNTADSMTLLRLGLAPWQVRGIYKYRAKGGFYRSKEDFANVPGLTVKEYRELEPFIRISADYRPASTLFARGHNHETQMANPQSAVSNNQSAVSNNQSSSADEQPSASDAIPSPRFPVKLKPGETIDLATADTTALKTVPGIGSYYARRIADYGRRLGGYVSVSQLDEIDDLPEDVKAFFVVSQPHPRRLAINRLSLSELKRHPYISYYQARAIADYRRTHGPIAHLSDLRLLPEFPPEAIARLEPYLDYGK